MNRCHQVDDESQKIFGILSEKGIHHIDGDKDYQVETASIIEELPEFLQKALMDRLELTRTTPVKPTPVINNNPLLICIPCYKPVPVVDSDHSPTCIHRFKAAPASNSEQLFACNLLSQRESISQISFANTESLAASQERV